MSSERVNMYFSECNVWVCAEGDVARIGITSRRQRELGGIISVSLPHVGESVRAGQIIVEAETGTIVEPLCSPISGIVGAVNEALSVDPGLVSRSPEDEGWMVEITMTDPNELDHLMTFTEYLDL